MANREPLYHEKALLPTDRVRWTEIATGVYALTDAMVIASADGTMIAGLDEITSALIGIDVVHHEVHEGEMFTVYLVDINLADDGTLMIRLQSTTKWPHITFTGACGGNATLELIENPTINVAGGALAERNNKRAGGETPTVTAFSDPTIAGGTVLVNAVIPGGTGGNSSGGFQRPDTEWIGERGEDYVVRLTNIAGNAQPASLVVNWYEESDN